MCRGYEVGRVDGVVEEDVSAGRHERRPPLEVRAHPLLAVVPVDEEQVDLRVDRSHRVRVLDMEPYLLGQAEPARGPP